MNFRMGSDLSRKEEPKGPGYTDIPNIEDIRASDMGHGPSRTSDSFWRATVESKRLTESDLSLPQRLRLRLFGHAYIEHRKRSGWKGPLPFYTFRCPIHGLVEDYPHGYGDRLDCPRCQREDELLKRLTIQDFQEKP